MTEQPYLGRTAHGEQRTRAARRAARVLAGLLIGLFIGLLIVHGACMSSGWEGAEPAVSSAGMAHEVMGARPGTGTGTGMGIGMGAGMSATGDAGGADHCDRHGRPDRHHPRQLPCCDHQAPHDRGALLSSSTLLLLGLAGLARGGLRIPHLRPARPPFVPRRSRPPRGSPRLALCVLRI